MAIDKESFMSATLPLATSMVNIAAFLITHLISSLLFLITCIVGLCISSFNVVRAILIIPFVVSKSAVRSSHGFIGINRDVNVAIKSEGQVH